MEKEVMTFNTEATMDIKSIPAGLFHKKENYENLHDQAFETKPISYLRGAFMRFAKNKASIIAAIVIGLLILYAIIVPFVSPMAYVNETEYPNGFKDPNFAYALPYNPVNKALNLGWWDGTEVKTGQGNIDLEMYELDDSTHSPIAEKIATVQDEIAGKIQTHYTLRIDSYSIGCKEINVSMEEYDRLVAYKKEQGIYHTEKGIMKPLRDYESYLQRYGDELREEIRVAEEEGRQAPVNENGVIAILDYLETYYNQHQRVWYELTARNYSQNNFAIRHDASNKVIPIYEMNGDELVYAKENLGKMTIRVDYYDYFTFHNGFEPRFFFGSNSAGEDIFYRLAVGTRFSLLLGVGISIINFIIGLIWGAVSGYYGGTTDLIMERITDIISCVPSIVILTIASVQFLNNAELKTTIGQEGIIVLAFLLAFVYSGWVGVAGTTRMQFYRFKGQEYVLASRTLGAKDTRLIFRHILPNAAGTLVTSSVLMIPGVIFGESTLSYLGVVNFSTSGLVSIGSLLNEGSRATLNAYPHMLFFPCVVISLLMICFNLFGNGLRDAFNTTLRGSED
ncbi:MAG: ABC transporter permease [Bacilli bacterium]|nr:ABC transporter permease [Bacilli bacterium]